VEHTLAITVGGVEILTADENPAVLAAAEPALIS
jgi:hypothetical protein